MLNRYTLLATFLCVCASSAMCEEQSVHVESCQFPGWENNPNGVKQAKADALGKLQQAVLNLGWVDRDVRSQQKIYADGRVPKWGFDDSQVQYNIYDRHIQIHEKDKEDIDAKVYCMSATTLAHTLPL